MTSCPYHGLGTEYRAFEHEGLHDFMTRARREEPVFFSPEIGYWVVTRRADVMTVMRDADRFSASPTLEPVTPFPAELQAYLRDNAFTVEPVQSNADRPKHTRIRALAGRFLNAKHYATYHPRIQALVDETLDGLATRERFDVVADLAYELPARVIFLLLGMEDVDPRRIKRWAANRVMLTWGRLAPEQMMAAGRELNDFFQYCKTVIDDRRQRPRDDYPSALLAMQGGDPAVLTDNELHCLVFALLLAGHEAVTNQIGNLVHTLLVDRSRWARLVREPSLIPNAVEEGLRFAGSNTGWRRRAIADTEIGGVAIPKDARILVSLASANRDESHFDDPHTYDPARANTRTHVEFGYGIHACIGAPLARFQLVTVLEGLLRRFPDLTLEPGHRPDWLRTILHRGMTALPVLTKGLPR